MTQEDKELLFKDICAKVPYGLMFRIAGHAVKISFNNTWVYFGVNNEYKEYIKPYLRPIESMTEEEAEEYRNIDNRAYSCPMDYAHIPASERIDWLNAHHFDYRGLIEKGLAIKVTKENNPYKD